MQCNPISIYLNYCLLYHQNHSLKAELIQKIRTFKHTFLHLLCLTFRMLSLPSWQLKISSKNDQERLLQGSDLYFLQSISLVLSLYLFLWYIVTHFCQVYSAELINHSLPINGTLVQIAYFRCLGTFLWQTRISTKVLLWWHLLQLKG